jgi:hypothetical protein
MREGAYMDATIQCDRDEWKLPFLATPSRLRRTPSLGAKSETYLIHSQ